MNNEFIDLNRQFQPISIDENDFNDKNRNFESLFSNNQEPHISWSDILQKPRVVILAEPGTGKTIELKQIATKLNDRGKPAFFCRIELLQDSSIIECLDVGTEDKFENWKKDSSVAWFLLDSVDEAKLSNPNNFEKALRKLARDIGNNWGRAHIVITCRVHDWYAYYDFNKFIDILKYPKPLQYEENDNDEQSVKEVTNALEPNVKDIVHQLVPLDENRIKSFAQAKDIEDIELFIEALLQNNLNIFAERPQDLIELIDFWKNHGKFGSFLEMLEFSITRKLIEVDYHYAEQLPLTTESANYGAERLAAAVTTCKKNNFVLPDRSNTHHLSKIFSINPEAVLSDKNPKEIKTLLGRAVFDEAIYGTVRFHHRIVREFLTAKWLHKLLLKQKRRRDIESLIVTVKYGRKIIPSSMQPIVAWLAIWDESILSLVQNIAPEILFTYGDPSTLPLNIRKLLLIELTKKYNESAYTKIYFDFTMLRRLASQDLSSTINNLLQQYQSNKDLCNLLLQIIWQGKIRGSVKTVLNFAANTNTERYSYIYALEIIKALASTDDCKGVIQKIISGKSNLDSYLSNEILSLFYPEQISIQQLLEIVAKTESEYHYNNLDTQLEKIIISEQNKSGLKSLLKGFVDLIKQKPFVEISDCNLSQKYQWLIKHAIHIINKYIQEKDSYALEPEILSLYLEFINAEPYIGSFDRYQEESWKNSAQEWSDFKYKFFWNAIQTERQSNTDNGNNISIQYWWQVNWLTNCLWQPNNEDLENLFIALDLKSNVDDKLVALSAIWEIYIKQARPRKLCWRMKKVVKGIPELESALNKLFNPPPKTAKEKERERKNKLHQRQHLKREQTKQQNKADWINYLNKNPNLLRDVKGDAKNGSVSKAIVYVYERLKEKSKNSSQWAYSEWRLLVEEFGDSVAEAFRDGCKSYWRHYNPYSKSDLRTNNSIPYARILGLTGLSMETQDDPNWLKKLNDDESTAVARYLTFELNGFPDWFSEFYQNFPKKADDVLLREIAWEIRECNENSYGKILQTIGQYSDILPDFYQDKIIALLESNEPENYFSLENSLLFLLENSINIDYKTRLLNLSCKRFQKSKQNNYQQLWLALLIQLNPNQAIETFKHWIGQEDTFDKQKEKVINFCGSLNRRVRLLSSNIHSKNKIEVNALEDLILLIYKYVDPDEDNQHKGTYSPNERDYAQRFRNSLIETLVDIPGQATYDALMELKQAIKDKSTSDYLEYKALERARLDAESEIKAWSESDVAEFSAQVEKEPKTQLDLFNLTISRLDNLKLDLEEGDDSNAILYLNPEASGEIENKINEEIIRNSFAYYLRRASNGQYTIDQENEYADGKRTDIRFNAPKVNSPIPIELKIADKWSYSQLLERIENQLIRQYMNISQYGVFLLVYQGEKNFWKNSSQEKFKFCKLVENLQAQANKLVQKYSKSNIAVTGIDFNLRLNLSQKIHTR